MIAPVRNDGKLNLNLPATELPTSLRYITTNYAQKLSAVIKQQGHALSTGLHAVFRVPSAIDAVHYRDGDGGTLDCTLTPGLKDYIEKMQWGDLLQPVGQDFFVEFRESNHDAVELGHTYTMQWRANYQAVWVPSTGTGSEEPSQL